MLLPEGMGKRAHIILALQTPHPFTLEPQLLPRGAFALKTRKLGLSNLKALRLESMRILIAIRIRRQNQWGTITTMVHPAIRRIVAPRCIAFLRELHAAIGSQGMPLQSDNVLASLCWDRLSRLETFHLRSNQRSVPSPILFGMQGKITH